jgi:hypothetical protein
MAMSPAAAAWQTHAKYARLIADAKRVPPAITVVVHPCDEPSLRGAVEAAEAGLIVPILVGPAAKIGAVARQPPRNPPRDRSGTFRRTGHGGHRGRARDPGPRSGTGARSCLNNRRPT